MDYWFWCYFLDLPNFLGDCKGKYGNCYREDKNLIDIINYFINIYGSLSENCELINQEISIKKQDNQVYKIKYAIVKEYLFSRFNHFYSINSDGIINRFKYNELIFEDLF